MILYCTICQSKRNIYVIIERKFVFYKGSSINKVIIILSFVIHKLKNVINIFLVSKDNHIYIT